MKQQIKVSRSIGASISPDTIVKFRSMGTVREVQTAPVTHREPVTQKVNADMFVDKRTGELIEIVHQLSRADNVRSVKDSLKRGRDMINANVSPCNAHCVRWVTLTYAENMTDPKRLYSDFDAFKKRLQRKCGKFEYITAAEPQRRGAWHLHCLFIFQDTAPFIPNDDLRRMWGQGFVKIQAVRPDCDNIGAYLSAYLGNCPLDEFGGDTSAFEVIECEVIDHNDARIKKKFVKGARMVMYPPGMQIFRFSRGLKKPEEVEMPYWMAKKILGAATPRYSSTCEIEIDERYKQVICYEQYNTVCADIQEEFAF